MLVCCLSTAVAVLLIAVWRLRRVRVDLGETIEVLHTVIETLSEERDAANQAASQYYEMHAEEARAHALAASTMRACAHRLDGIADILAPTRKVPPCSDNS